MYWSTVSHRQMLAWLKNPVPASQLNTIPEFGCQTPAVSQNICNGMVPNENGLLDICPFEDYYWATCYGCVRSARSRCSRAPHLRYADARWSNLHRRIRTRLKLRPVVEEACDTVSLRTGEGPFCTS